MKPLAQQAGLRRRGDIDQRYWGDRGPRVDREPGKNGRRSDDRLGSAEPRSGRADGHLQPAALAAGRLQAELLGKNYDAGRRFYTQDYTDIDFITNENGVVITFNNVNGVEQPEVLPYGLANLMFGSTHRARRRTTRVPTRN